MSHTPSPWQVGESEGRWWVEGPDKNANVICDLLPRRIDVYDYAAHQEEVYVYTDEDRANAALIAAAPDLLHACEWAHHLLVDGYSTEFETDVINDLVAAIAKAKAQQVTA